MSKEPIVTFLAPRLSALAKKSIPLIPQLTRVAISADRWKNNEPGQVLSFGKNCASGTKLGKFDVA